MTVPVPGSLTYSYDEDGITTVFAYPVRFFEPQELEVVREVGGGHTTLTYNVDYTVSGAGSPSGGSITRAAATDGGKIIITRNTAWKQSVDLTNNGRNPAESVEQQLDRLTMAGQDSYERFSPLADKADDLDNAVALANAAANAAEAAAASLNLPTIGAGDAGKYLVVKQDETGYEFGGGATAEDVTYDPTSSGLSATDVQGAIDELASSSGGDVAGGTHAAASKTTPVDADELPLIDSAASWGLKKLTWASIKAALSSVFLSKTGGTMTGRLTLVPADDDPDGTASLNIPAGADVPDVQVDGDLWADSNEDLRYRRGGVDAAVYDTVNLPRPAPGEMATGTETEPRAMSAADVQAAVSAQLASKMDGVFTGTGAGETVFPVGHLVFVSSAAGARNSTASVKLGSETHDYSTSGAGTALAGTWRFRGGTIALSLAQRVS